MGAMLVRHEPMSASAVRHEIADDLARKGFARESIDDVVLVASELVGNAIKHAAPPHIDDLDVAWTVADGEVFVSVSDRSDELPYLRVPGAADTSGRGLAIVEALSTSWGVDGLPEGKRVWAKVAVH